MGLPADRPDEWLLAIQLASLKTHDTYVLYLQAKAAETSKVAEELQGQVDTLKADLAAQQEDADKASSGHEEPLVWQIVFVLYPACHACCLLIYVAAC